MFDGRVTQNVTLMPMTARAQVAREAVPLGLLRTQL